MFDVIKVNSSLFGQVGFKQPTDPDYSVVDSDNQASSSGRYFTDNSFVKVQTIKDTQDYPDISDAEFNDKLKDLQNRAITSVVDSVFNRSDFIDRQVLYKYANNKVNLETLEGDFVGYRIQQTNDKNYTFEIKRVLLEFNGTGDVELLLYNSAKLEPIKREVVTISSTFQEVELNWKMDNSDSFYKGEYFFGYRTLGLTVTPFERDYNNAITKSCITGLDLIPFYVEQADENIFDFDSINNSPNSWGLNPDVIVYDDYTDFIIQNGRLFSYAIQLQGQIECISQYISSIRSNNIEQYSKDLINSFVFEIEGITTESVKKTGLKTLLATEITKLKAEVKRLQSGLFGNGLPYVVRS